MAKPPRLVPVPAAGWRQQLRRGQNGVPITDLANCLIAFRGEPAFRAAFAYDEMQQFMKVLQEPPLARGADAGPPTPRLYVAEDTTRAQEWLQCVGLPRVARDHVQHALELVARENTIHPLRDWLKEVGDQWDGVPRMNAFLHKALGCPDNEYHRQIGAMFLIAMVARIFEPGCKADYMMVLEGPQGEEKSKFCRLLAGDDYFSDRLPRLETDLVRVSMHLRGKWLIEIAELNAFNRAEAVAIKNFISAQVEIYTPKYERAERHEPRQCLFIGTTNDGDYIRDDTGGRRFWPVVVEGVRLDWLAENRAQLFAEAVEQYRLGRAWWPERDFEREVIAPVQEVRTVQDALYERMMEISERKDEWSVAEMGQLLGLDTSKLDMLAQKRIASVFRNRMKWDKVKTAKGSYVWRKSIITDPLDRNGR